MRKLAVSLADSSDLRVILSVFYTIVEVLRHNQEDDSDEYKQIQDEFRNEICKSLIFSLISQFFYYSICSFCTSYFN